METSQEVKYNEGFLSVQPQPTSSILNPVPLARFDSTIAETNWDPAKILAREQIVKKIFWDTTTAPGEDLRFQKFFQATEVSSSKLNVPYDLMTNEVTQSVLKTFTYYRGDFVVTLTVTGTKFHAGMIMPYFVPLTRQTTFAWNTPFLVNHTMIEANGVNTATLRIPYMSQRSYISTYDSPACFNLGVIGFRVIAPLAAATGSLTSIPVTVSFHMERLEMYVPSLTPTTCFPTPSFVVSSKSKPRVTGEKHSTDPHVNTLPADSTSVPTIGGPGLKCTHNPNYDSPESLRDILKRSTAVGQGNLAALANYLSMPPLTGSMLNRLYMFGWMDAGAILNPQVSNHPASYWASMYSMAKGSLRYTFIFDGGSGTNGATSEFISYGAVFMPGTFYPLRVSDNPDNLRGKDLNHRRLILPGSTTLVTDPGIPDTNRIYNDLVVQPMLDALNFIPRENVCNNEPYSTATPNGDSTFSQYYSNLTSGGCVALADNSHNQISMDIPFICQDNAYALPRYRTVGEGTVSEYRATTLGWYRDDMSPDFAPYTDDTPPAGSFSYMDQEATYGPHMSPGTIVFFAMSNTNLTGGAAIAMRRLNVSVYASLGDDFRFGGIRGVPMEGQLVHNVRQKGGDLVQDTTWKPIHIPQFGAWGLGNLDAFASRPGTVSGEPHGNTITTINKFRKAANVTLPMNVTGDRFDTNATLHTTAMDKPSNTLGPMPMMPGLTSPLPNSTGIVNTTRMALRADETFEASPELFATEEDEMDLCYLTRKLTLVGITNWDIATSEGEPIFSVPLSPFPYDDNISISTEPNLPMLSLVANHFLYWSGSLRYRIKVVGTSFHTGRLFISIAHFPFRDFARQADDFQGRAPYCASRYSIQPPLTLSEAMAQGGVYLDLSDENRDITIDVPYKSMHPRLHTASAAQPHQTSAMGKLSIWVLNALSSPETVQTSVDVVVMVGGGPDFHLHTMSPFAAMTDSARPWFNGISTFMTNP
jgi:hypothetical protein